MVDMPRRRRFDLFPSTKVNNMLDKIFILNNDVVPFLACFFLNKHKQ